MADVTRRGFLAKTAIATGVGIAGGFGLRQMLPAGAQADAAAGSLVAVSPPAAASPSGVALATVSAAGPFLTEPLVVHVRNVSTAEIGVMVGTQEFVYRDPELVARLVKAASSAVAEG